MAATNKAAMTLGRALLLLAASQPALAQVMLDLCADFNTADMGRNTSIYQTNGLCSTFCRDDYAYAVTQEQNCWCTNFTPQDDTQVDMDRCDITCPAYPSERCGGRGLFGYVELNGHLPSGTKGPEDEQTTSTTTSTTVESTTTSEEETTTTSTTSSSSTSTTSSTTEEEEETETSTSSRERTTEMQTLTTSDNGVIRTVTVNNPEPTNGNADGSENSGEAADDGGGLGTGAIVGIVVGVVGAILIAAGIILWWFLKRRKSTAEQGYQEDPSVRGSSSSRMGGSVNPDMASIASPASGSNRNSTLHIDPRMDPFKQGLYARAGSHESLNTLRDDHDYSRRILRATNPDPNTET